MAPYPHPTGGGIFHRFLWFWPMGSEMINWPDAAQRCSTLCNRTTTWSLRMMFKLFGKTEVCGALRASGRRIAKCTRRYCVYAYCSYVLMRLRFVVVVFRRRCGAD